MAAVRFTQARKQATTLTLLCAALTTWLSLASVGCSPNNNLTNFHSGPEYPTTLSAWSVINRSESSVEVASDSMVYDLNSALFSDYAHKLRTLHIPPGTTTQYRPYEAFDFPTGTVVSKTFFYPVNEQGQVHASAQASSFSGNPIDLDPTKIKLIETRLLVRQDQGWHALPYKWEGDEAYLVPAGDLITLQTTAGGRLNYLIPSRNQCAGCHATNHTSGEIQPIGLKARHLNKAGPIGIDAGNQLLATGLNLSGLPPLEDIAANANLNSPNHDNDTLAARDHRARSYLDINCGHCHNPAGAADTSGLLLDYQAHSLASLGFCKPPIAAGRGSGGHLYSVVPGRAAASIMPYRMATTDPAAMMPELGRALVDTSGVKLINDWINGLTGECR